MSGIAGIVNFDGAPIDRKLLQGMTEAMAYRGPDAQSIWTSGDVGFGHAMLQTTPESLLEEQPCSLDGGVWITADARVDGRAGLIQELTSRGRFIAANVPDAILILHAYHVWGTECVTHLIGDFAFAIWDEPQRQLFCARDHFGVKPFYYAQVGDSFIFSNTLNCIRLHPRVSDRLNEAAIGDFLLFGLNYNLETTTFSDIQRLRAAHTLTLSRTASHRRRYWDLPVVDLVRYQRSRDYVEHFNELMGVAVADRLRTEKAAIFFSGGLDSTTVAATALQQAKAKHQKLDLQAYTVVYDHLIHDEERHYSGLAANALGIPVHYLVADDYLPYEGWGQPGMRTPEPSHEPQWKISHDLSKAAADENRVAFYGEGADEALPTTTVRDAIGKMPALDLAGDVARCLFAHRLFPPIGSGILARIRRWTGRKPRWLPESYPGWLNAGFAARVNLPERWKEINSPSLPPQTHLREESYLRLKQPLWDSVLEAEDPGVTGFPLEMRWPFLDLRLLRFLLALPPLPWCAQKTMLRTALRGSLPASLLARPKSPLTDDPVAVHLRQGEKPWKEFQFTPEMASYVDTESLLQFLERSGLVAAGNGASLRPVSLSYWLDQQSQTRIHVLAGTVYSKQEVRQWKKTKQNANESAESNLTVSPSCRSTATLQK